MPLAEPTLSITDKLQMDHLCLSFEASLKRGEAPRIECDIKDMNEPVRSELLRQLLLLELDYRLRRGEAPDRQEYHDRFPQHTSVIEQAFRAYGTGADAGSAPPVISGGRDWTSSVPKREEQSPSADSIPGYSIVREIHRGGQGVVYQAIQKTTRRKVAIKVMREGPFASKHEKARFEREVQVLAALKHPNVVAIHDSGSAAGSFFFVMDYISGQPLDVYMAAGPRSVRETLTLFQKICEAVNAAHLRGVIHRDLKPGNILIDSQGEPQILDFGLAKVALADTGQDSLLMTMTGQFVGSLPWASPEQAEGIPGKIDVRTDVYSLGMVLYQMLTGKFPYDVVGGFREVLDRIMTAPPVRPGMLRKDVDDEVETIVLKTLAKDRDRRYQSAGELARDIGHYLAGEPLEAKRDSTWYVLRKNLRHYKAPIAAVLAFVLLLAGFAATMSIQARRNLQLADKELAAREQADRQRDLARAAEGKATERAEDLRRTLYASHLALTRHAFESGQVGHAGEYLYSCPADLRGWEWYWLARITDQSKMNLRGHIAWVNAVASSPDGTRIVSGCADGLVGIWEADSGRRIRVLSGHADTNNGAYWPPSSGVLAVAFSPDGTRFVTASQDKTLRIWDAVEGSEVGKLQGHEDEVRSAVFSPDGTRILSGSNDKTLRLWDPQTGSLLVTLAAHQAPVTSVAFDPAGKRMASGGSDGLLKVWDAKSYSEIHALDTRQRCVEAIAFSPDNRWIASGGEDGTVKTWNASTGEQHALFPGDGAIVHCLAFNPTAKQIVSGYENGALKLWDTSSGDAAPVVLHGHEGAVQSVAWAPDARRVISGSLDKTIRIWDTSARPHALVLPGHAASVVTLAISPDSRRIVSGSADSTLRIWDAMTGSQIHVLADHRHEVHCVAFSPDNKHIASASEDGTIRVWDADLGAEVQTIRGPPVAVRAVAFSPDGRWIVSSHCTVPTTLQLWALPSGRMFKSIWMNNGSSLRGLAVSPDGERIAAAGWEHKVGVWDREAGERIWTSSRQESPLCCVAFSPDGRRIVTGSNEGILTVWNAQTGEKELTLRGNGNWVKAIFSPDGKRIISGSDDGTLRIWHSGSGEELMILRHTSAIRSVTMASDRSFVAAGGEDGRLLIWYSGNPSEIEQDPDLAIRLIQSAALLASRGILEESRPLVAEAMRILSAQVGQQGPHSLENVSENLMKLVAPGEEIETLVSHRGQSLFEPAPIAEWDMRIFPWNRDQDLREHEGKWEAMAAGPSAARMKTRTIDFDWEFGAPGPGLPADYFGVLATTNVNLRAGIYWLRTLSDDGVRVWIDGRRLIDNWTRHAETSDTAWVALEDGEHRIRVEYCEIVLAARLAFGMWLLAPDKPSPARSRANSGP